MGNRASMQYARAVMIFSLIGAMPLSGCSSLTTPEVDWQHGAKRAVVERMYFPTDLRGDNVPLCLKSVPESERVLGQYAVVSHWEGRSRRWKSAKVADGLTVGAGDEVEINPFTCGADALPVITKVLRHPDA